MKLDNGGVIYIYIYIKLLRCKIRISRGNKTNNVKTDNMGNERCDDDKEDTDDDNDVDDDDNNNNNNTLVFYCTL